MFKSGDYAGQEDVEVHLHALQSMTEQFHLCHLGKLHCCLKIMGFT
jgi:hypothetical protein